MAVFAHTPIGTNLSTKNRLRLWQLFWKYMIQASGSTGGRNRLGRPRKSKYKTFLVKRVGGAPVNNAAGDAPDRLGQIVIDQSSSIPYLNITFVNATSHTWLKMSA